MSYCIGQRLSTIPTKDYRIYFLAVFFSYLIHPQQKTNNTKLNSLLYNIYKKKYTEEQKNNKNKRPPHKSFN